MVIYQVQFNEELHYWAGVRQKQTKIYLKTFQTPPITYYLSTTTHLGVY